jgi:hypothetical protein
MLNDVVALAGILSSAAIAIVTILTEGARERRREAREARTRFHDRRREVYSRFSAAAFLLAAVAEEEFESDVSYQHFVELHFEIELIAGPEVRSAAAQLRSATEGIMQHDPEGAPLRLEAFRQAVRLEIGEPE